MSEKVHISSHAISRCIERTSCATVAEAEALLSQTAIMIAARSGLACSVKLPSGHCVVIQDGTIITVRPKPGEYRRRRRGHGSG